MFTTSFITATTRSYHSLHLVVRNLDLTLTWTSIIMIIRFAYLASALSLAAASKSAKTPPFIDLDDNDLEGQIPEPLAKAGKSSSPVASKSSKGKTADEYFIAPFSCPQECISAHGYEAQSHLLVDAVVECDVNDSYQKWKVHRVGSLLKFESFAQHDHDMCLAVVHQDPDHGSNEPGAISLGQSSYPAFFTIGGNDMVHQDPEHASNAPGAFGITGLADGDFFVPIVPPNFADIPNRRNLLSEDEVDGMCSEGKLGMAHCNHPGSYWYSTGGNLLSALCWDQGTPTAMSVDETCTGMNVLNTTMTGDLTTSETFMILGSN